VLSGGGAAAACEGLWRPASEITGIAINAGGMRLLRRAPLTLVLVNGLGGKAQSAALAAASTAS
jgi:hypothetical protein